MSYREKSRVEDASYDTYWYHSEDYGERIASEGWGHHEYIGLEELIRYYVGTDRSTYRPCHHTKFEFTPGNTAWQVSFVEPGHDGQTGIPPVLPTDIDAISSAGGIHDIDRDAFCSRAVQAMTPSMSSGFSGANFLWEISEVANIGQSVADIFKLLMSSKKKPKNLLDAVSDGSLFYNFGIKTLIQDCKDLFEGLTTLDERLSNLQKEAGRPQLRHYTEKFDVDASEVITPAPGGLHKLCKAPYEAVYTATMQFSYTLPDLTRQRRYLRALLDTLGLKLNAEEVWNVIPFSFVVDWFIPVSDWLSQFSSDYLKPNLHIGGFGYSRKVELRAQQWYARTTLGFSGEPILGVYQPGGLVTYKKYSRNTAMPSPHWFAFDQFGKLTSKKVYLGSMLLWQRTGR